MLLEMASLEGRGSLCGISRHGGSQGKVDTTPVQTAKRGVLEAPVECERRNRSLRFWGPLVQMHRFLQDHQPPARLSGSLMPIANGGKKRPQPSTQWGAIGELLGSPTTFTGKAMLCHPPSWQENCHHTTEGPPRLADNLTRGHSLVQTLAWRRPKLFSRWARKPARVRREKASGATTWRQDLGVKDLRRSPRWPRLHPGQPPLPKTPLAAPPLVAV